VRIPLFCLWLASIASLGHATDGDPVKNKLDTARGVFQEQRNVFRTGVLELLKLRAENAAKTQNEKLIDLIAKETSAFVRDGTLPTCVEIKALKDNVTKAMKVMIAAYKIAEGEYRNQGKRTEAMLVAEDREDVEWELAGRPDWSRAIAKRMRAPFVVTPRGGGVNNEYRVGELHLAIARDPALHLGIEKNREAAQEAVLLTQRFLVQINNPRASNADLQGLLEAARLATAKAANKVGNANVRLLLKDLEGRLNKP